MFVSWFDILVVSPVAWELCRVRAKLRTGSVGVQEVLGDGSFNFISIARGESLAVG